MDILITAFATISILYGVWCAISPLPRRRLYTTGTWNGEPVKIEVLA